MNQPSHLLLLAQYNQWMNRKLFAAASVLSDEAISADRGAFFGSILGTLNHLAVGDTIWLKRFAEHPDCASSLCTMADRPLPRGLDDVLFADLRSLQDYREALDEVILAFASTLSDKALASTLTYSNTKGIRSRRSLHALLIHFFNHQTHHRGQVSTLLFQAGVDPGMTDLLAVIPQETID